MTMDITPATLHGDGEVDLDGVRFIVPRFADTWIHGWQIIGGEVEVVGHYDTRAWSDGECALYRDRLRLSRLRLAPVLRRLPVVGREFIAPGPPSRIVLMNNMVLLSREHFPKFEAG